MGKVRHWRYWPGHAQTRAQATMDSATDRQAFAAVVPITPFDVMYQVFEACHAARFGGDVLAASVDDVMALLQPRLRVGPLYERL